LECNIYYVYAKQGTRIIINSRWSLVFVDENAVVLVGFILRKNKIHVSELDAYK